MKTRFVLVVYQNLGPTGQSQKTEGLRLDLDRNIEFLLKTLIQHLTPSIFCVPISCFRLGLGDGVKADLHNSINPERYRTDCPKEHHQPGQPIRLFLLPIEPYLRDQLNAPEDGTNGAEDIGGDGDVALRCHCLSGEVILKSGQRAFGR